MGLGSLPPSPHAGEMDRSRALMLEPQPGSKFWLWSERHHKMLDKPLVELGFLAQSCSDCAVWHFSSDDDNLG